MQNPSKNVLMEVRPSFKRKVFEELTKKYTSFELAKLLDKAASTIRNYKTSRSKGVPLTVMKKAAELSKIDANNFCSRTIRIYDDAEERKKNLNQGAKIRKARTKSYR